MNANKKVYTGDGGDIPVMGLVKNARMINNEKPTDEVALRAQVQSQVGELDATVSADFDKWVRKAPHAEV
ncbi:MAG: hypothetical protein HQL39_02780 [Alphaproteobacteria bacterium]|nr:hypothetical protein [Alphaproteobacteria bacterium]